MDKIFGSSVGIVKLFQVVEYAPENQQNMEPELYIPFKHVISIQLHWGVLDPYHRGKVSKTKVLTDGIVLCKDELGEPKQGQLQTSWITTYAGKRARFDCLNDSTLNDIIYYIHMWYIQKNLLVQSPCCIKKLVLKQENDLFKKVSFSTPSSNVVSTYPWNTPLNLYRVSRDSSIGLHITILDLPEFPGAWNWQFQVLIYTKPINVWNIYKPHLSVGSWLGWIPWPEAWRLLSMVLGLSLTGKNGTTRAVRFTLFDRKKVSSWRWKPVKKPDAEEKRNAVFWDCAGYSCVEILF